MSHDAERAYVASVLDHRDAQLERARAEMDRRVSELRDEWSAGVAHQVAAAEAAARQRQEARIEWLRSLAGDDDAANEPPAGSRTDASASTANPAGHSDSRQEPDPRAAELAEVSRLKALSMSDYAEERERLGIGSSARARGIFTQ